jgi:toxin HigB-1
MIRSWANSATRKFAQMGKSKFSGLDEAWAREVLFMLNDVKALSEITALKSYGLHALKGGRKGRWALTVNGPWRVCFRFSDGDAHDVEIVDYH